MLDSSSIKMSDMIPIFSSSGSLGGKSLLTVEKKSKDGIKQNSPVSIIDICDKYDLDKCLLLENDPCLLLETFQNFKDIKTQLIYGTWFQVCANPENLTEESLLEQAKIGIIFNNDKGYRDWVRIWNLYAPIKENFYYTPRISWDKICENWTENLTMVWPPFSNPIHKNLLCNGKVIPRLDNIKPIIFWADMGLAWNNILNKAIKNYAESEGFTLQQVNPVYYYRTKDVKNLQAYRSICRSSGGRFDNPKLENFTSDKFSFENWCLSTGKKFLD